MNKHLYSVLSITLFVTIIKTIRAEDYCALFGYDHTMCKYRAGQAGYDCTIYGAPTIFNRPVSGKLRKIIVDYHNAKRSEVALGKTHLPQASDMMALKWNKKLAEVAQRWADQCKKSHDCDWPGNCRNVTIKAERGIIGQNVYWQTEWRDSPYKFNPKDGIDSWYKEIEGMSSSYVDEFPNWTSSVITHFTQMVQGTTRLVGCGIVEFPRENWGNYIGYSFELVCNYAPGGNLIGTRLYQRGTPGSKCPKKTTVKDGLCVW